MPRFFEHFGYFFAGGKTVFAHQNLGFFVERAVVVQNINDGQFVLNAQLVVVQVVGGGYFEATRAKIHRNVFVQNNRNLTANERNQHRFAMQVQIAFVVWINANSHISHNGFRARSGNHKPPSPRWGSSFNSPIGGWGAVSNIIQLRLNVFINYLLIRKRGFSLRVPVHHSHTAINLAFVVEPHKGFDDRLVIIGIHRKIGAVPVAGSTQFFELFQNDAAVFVFPFVGVLQKFIAGQVFFVNAAFFEHGHHLGFGGDGGMVGARHPAGFFAFHAGFARQNVLNGVVEHVAHVQLPRYVWRRNDNGIRLLVGIRFRVEIAVFQPISIPFGFNFLRCVGF